MSDAWDCMAARIGTHRAIARIAAIPVHELFRSLISAAEAAPLVVGHRGSAATHPENTVSSFEAAASTPGVDVIEFDVRQTQDGAWICIHDATADRTTDAAAVFGRNDIAVHACTLADLRQLNAGALGSHPEPIPTLAEALEIMQPRVVPMIERKGGDAVDLARVLRATGGATNVIVQSFDWTWLRAFHLAAPQIAVGALATGSLTSDRAEEALTLGAELLHWDVDGLDFDALDTAAGARAMSCIYTTDREAAWMEAARAGIHAIVTNDPGRMSNARGEGRLSR